MARRADPSKAGEQLTRGHKKKARTRQQLVETAVRLFAEGVGQELSLTRLAEAAGTSHGTVYNYFRTREEMMEAVGLALAEQFSHEVISFSAGLVSGAERLAVGVRSFVRKAQAEPAWGSALVRVVRYDEGLRSALAGYVRADLRAGAEQGDFRYASEELALAMVVAGTTAAVATLLEEYAVEHHDSAVAEMLLLALGLPPDRARATARLPMPTRG
jgi:AcrR family transcriptional regulator